MCTDLKLYYRLVFDVSVREFPVKYLFSFREYTRWKCAELKTTMCLLKPQLF